MDSGDKEGKTKLRSEILRARSSLSPHRRRILSEVVFEKVLALPEYERARTVLAYCGFGSEPDTAGFLESVISGGRRLVLPRVVPGGDLLVLHEVTEPDSQLAPGIWGIEEPGEHLPEVEANEPDFILLPGVAFDLSGGRLGYGGGYYDRLLDHDVPEKPTLVAAAFDLQIAASVPTEVHDRPVDIIVTESGVFRVSG